MNSPRELFQIVLRVPKEDSAFTYFILEAHEGLCLYSTVDYKQGQPHRDLLLVGDKTYRPQVLHLIHQLKQYFPTDIISQEILPPTSSAS